MSRTDEPIRANADVLVEISWEVCNKVGGIHTVIVSKAALMKEYYPNYLVIGPYLQDNALFEFEEERPPEQFRSAFDALAQEGIVCHYGTWQVKGEPKAILVDYRSQSSKKDYLKARLWEWHGIDSIASGWDFEEQIIWSWACSRLVEQLVKGPWAGRKVVTHHHEWLAGLSMLFLKRSGAQVRSVFTTHATMLGRSVMAHGQDLYGTMGSFDALARARELGVQDKHTTEVACARNADIFTTVSEITALEAEKLLGRRPEVLVLNGLDAGRFPTIEETSIKHVSSRERLREFQTYYFFPFYHNFKLEHNLMFCISGRYEYANKGIDVFIDALARLNDRLKAQGGERTVTVFFWIPAGTRGVRQTLLENKSYFRHIKGYVEWHGNDILKKITYDFITSNDPSKEGLYTQEFMHEMKRDVLHFKREGDPPISTHNLADEAHDPIVQQLIRVGLDNKPDDKVKVIFYPCYLDGNDSLTNLSYYDALAGTHFAIFPSAYEPWGYTPLEAAAMGVPTLTTDLAGFGRFIKPKLLDEQPGVYVLDRYQKPREQVVDNLYETLLRFAMLDHAERVQNKINAKQASKLADWRHLVKNYVLAHNYALEK